MSFEKATKHSSFQVRRPHAVSIGLGSRASVGPAAHDQPVQASKGPSGAAACALRKDHPIKGIGQNTSRVTAGEHRANKTEQAFDFPGR